jgi:flagellar biosynthesis protein FlhG
MQKNKELVPQSYSHKAKIISISGGKGGIGKTFFTVNFAAELTDKGYKVLIFDADINLSNVNIMLHINSNKNFKDYLDDKISFEDVIQKGLCGIDVVYVGDELKRIMHVDDNKLQRLYNSIRQIENNYDFILIDTQAGVHDFNIKLITYSDQIILLANPELTALVDLYKMIKILSSYKKNIHVYIVVNKAGGAENASTIFLKIKHTIQEFRIKAAVSFLGYIVNDTQRVVESIQKQTPLVLLNESSNVRQCFALTANAFLKTTRPVKKKLFFMDLLRRR